MAELFDVDEQLKAFFSAQTPGPERSVDGHQIAGNGRSGAVVVLVWLTDGQHAIVKFGPHSEILEEFDGRTSLSDREDELKDARLDVQGPRFEIDKAGYAEGWSSLGYIWIGAKSYDELTRFGDFEKLVVEYMDGTRRLDQQFDHVIRQLLDRLLDKHDKGDRTAPAPVPRRAPLSRFLPAVKWEAGLANGFALLEAARPGRGYAELPAWFEAGVSDMSIAPYPDRRRLHGDPRMANIMVDLMGSKPDLIDFGNTRLGHVFEDLVRFEVDLWLRATASGGTSEAERIDAISTLVSVAHPTFAAGSPILHQVLGRWRARLIDKQPTLGRDAEFKMYRWFLFAEMLKRMRWARPGGSEEAGQGAAFLVDVIDVLRSEIDTSPTVEWPLLSRLRGIASVPSDAAEPLAQLGIRHAYAPIDARNDPSVNDLRNQRKNKALVIAAERHERLRLIAETGNSYLSVRGLFHQQLKAMLKSGARVQVIVLEEDVGTAMLKGMTDAHVADFISKHLAAMNGALDLLNAYPDQLELRWATRPLPATILFGENFSFFEPYVPFVGSIRHTVLFETFELEFDTATVEHMRHVLNGHWKYLVEHSKPVTVEDLAALAKRNTARNVDR